MSKLISSTLWLLVILLAGGTSVRVPAVENFEYDGLKKCKGCHKSQYKSWQKTSHAKALRSLESGGKGEG